MTPRPSPTPSQTVGPFFGFALPFPGDADASAPDGESVRIEGQVLDGQGEHLSHIMKDGVFYKRAPAP